MKWTKEQAQAIDTKGCKLLVAAGAGSGKTAVLVERIIKKIIEDKVDIDRLLVVTFTNAAASEMRERILDAIYKKLPEFPELNKQIVLLNKASIMTIDAFCKKVIKDNFFSIGLDPNFSVCDSTECELLKIEALDEVLEGLYEENPDLIELYSDNKSDENFRKLILKIYSFIQSCPFPHEWLSEKCEMYNIKDTIDFGNTIWGKELIKYAREEVLGIISELEEIEEDLKFNNEATNYLQTIQDDILMLKALRLNNSSWDDFYNEFSNIKFASLKRAPKLDEETAEEVKEIRNKAKTKIQKHLRDEIFISDSNEIFSDIEKLYTNLKEVCDTVIKFSNAFKEKKINRNLVDFSDMEHMCLDLLSSNEAVSNMYKNQYEEILIDEYQDSNLIQEYILNTISNGNIFMVGDVKQSIYKFRQARPELFLDKYTKYHNLEDGIKETENKILLFKNFRSNINIIEQCNFIFKSVMSKEVGEIEYDDSESLKFGASYYLNNGTPAEIHLIDKGISDDEEYEELEDDIEDKPQLEARVVAKRIEELVGNFEVYDKKTGVNRKAEYKDVVILLRATKGYADSFVSELSSRNIPVFADINSGYFDNMEVQVIMSLLKIIDNPYQDIPLLAVMRSQIGNFTSNELTDIRLIDRNCSFFEAMQKKAGAGDEKVSTFLNSLYEWRKKAKYLSLGELVWLLYKETGYYDYISLMPNGNVRTANLDALLNKAEKFDSSSYKGLFNFINYMDNMKETSGDIGSSKSLGENDNVVRIMSIHKSKGLEFPIVFLSGTARKFNKKDTSNKIILHQDYGFGLDIVDLENRIMYETVPKLAMKQKAIQEALSEEMRILYVALTRAREKLIVTVLDNSIDKKIDNWSRKQTTYTTSNAKSFADWICGTVFSTTNDWEIRRWSYTEVLKLSVDIDENNYESFIDNIDKMFQKSSTYENIIENFSWKYPYQNSTKLPSKITVTELKRLGDELSIVGANDIIEKPSFMDDTEQSGGKFGTILHSMMQRVNFEDFNIDEILHNADKKYFYLLKKYLMQFEKTKLCEEIKIAKHIYKEMPFNLSMPLKEIYADVNDRSIEDKILVQGVIDLYYETEDGLVLVDYKTDNLDTKEAFITRYKTQLDYYRRALETLTGKKVIKVIIYSFKLNEEIMI